MEVGKDSIVSKVIDLNSIPLDYCTCNIEDFGTLVVHDVFALPAIYYPLGPDLLLVDSHASPNFLELAAWESWRCY